MSSLYTMFEINSIDKITMKQLSNHMFFYGEEWVNYFLCVFESMS